MYLGIDLGTTNVKAVVVDGGGQIVATGSTPVDRFTTPDGGVEQDIEHIWTATCTAIRQATSNLNGVAVRAVGVSSQGGALQLLDVEEKPIGRVISWLDRRGLPFDLEITRELGEDFLERHIGHGASLMAIGQILRLQKQTPELFSTVRHIAFVGDLIVGRLCGRRAHDPTSLSIAMLYNPWLEQADPELLARLGIEEDQLPDLLPATTPAGELHRNASQQTGLPTGIPVSPAVHDQYAVSLGMGAVGQGNIMLGTGTAWVLLASCSQLVSPITKEAFVCSHLVPGFYGQMLPLRTGGSAIEWALKLTGHDKRSPDTIDQLLAESPSGSNGLRCRPSIGSSFQLDGNVTLSHRPCHLLRAVVEGLACELARYLVLLGEAGLPITQLTMCGSAAASSQTPQIIADITRLPVACVNAFDVSALGAATIARSMVEKDISLTRLIVETAPTNRTFLPDRDATFYNALFEQYMQHFDTQATKAAFS